MPRFTPVSPAKAQHIERLKMKVLLKKTIENRTFELRSDLTLELPNAIDADKSTQLYAHIYEQDERVGTIRVSGSAESIYAIVDGINTNGIEQAFERVLAEQVGTTETE